MPEIDLTDAEVVLTGISNGSPITLSGKVKDVRLSVKSDEPYLYQPRNEYTHLVPYERYFLEFKKDEDNRMYTVKRNPRGVFRTARTEATDRSLAALTAARVRCGAPETAEVSFLNRPLETNNAIIRLASDRQVIVEFSWSEEI